jgi:MFS family permease
LFLFIPFVHSATAYVGIVLLYQAIASIGTLGYAQVMRSTYPGEVRGQIMGSIRVGMAVAWTIAALVGGRLMQSFPFQWVFAAAAVSGMASAIVFRRMRPPPVVEETDPISLSSTWTILREDHTFRRFLGAFFAFGFGAWLIAPAIPIFLVDVLTASNFQVGLLGAVTSGTWLLSYRYWGKMIDLLSAAKALGRVFLVGAATPFLYLVAWTPWVVLLAGTTDGLTSAGVDLGWLTAVLEFAPRGQVRKYVGIYNTFVGIRAAVAPFLTGLLIPHLGVRPIFAISIGLTLTGAALIRRTPGPRAEPSKG